MDRVEISAVSYQDRDQNSPSQERSESAAAGQSHSAAPLDNTTPRESKSTAPVSFSSSSSSSSSTPEETTAAAAASASSPSSIPPQEREIRQDTREDLDCLISSIGQMSISLEEMARDQAMDPEFRRISADARTGLHLRAVDLGQRKLIVDVSNGPARPFVPFSWRRKVFDVMHGLGHPGVERTRQTVAEKFVWPSLRSDVTKWARECIHCQRAKILRHVAPPIGDFEIPDKRFAHLNLDLVTMTPSNGFRYLLTMVDRFSRWPVAIPIKDMAVDTILDAFAHGWVAHYGVPSSITTDRRSQFLSAAWGQLMTTWGIKTHTTTSYHPEANGMVERLHRRLKEALLASSQDHPENWYWQLPTVMLSLRTTLKPDLGTTPAEMVFGEQLTVPGTLLPNAPSSEQQLPQQQRDTLANLRLEVARLQPIPTSTHRRPNIRLPDELQTCTHVFIRKGGVQPCLSSPYQGPYRVLSRQPHFFKVSIPGRGAESVAISRLKPAVIANDREFQQNLSPVTPPPRRGPGRPPNRRQEDPPPPSPPAHPSSPPAPASFPPAPASPSLAPPSPPPAPTISPPPARPNAARGRRSPQPPRCFLEDSPPRPPAPPPPARTRGRPRRDPAAGANSITLLPLPSTTFSEPNRSSGQQPQEEELGLTQDPLPVETEPVQTGSESSARIRPRPDAAARAAAAQPSQTGFGQQPDPSRAGSKPVTPRAAGTHQPLRFTRPDQRIFSKERKDRPNVSYAGPLAAILAKYVND